MANKVTRRIPVPMVVSQHAEEAAFRWLLRSDAVGAPHYDLKDLTDLDNLVDAHLDGLRIAGETGWDICRNELGWKEPGELFTAGVLALESGNPERIQAVVDAAVETPETTGGLVSALGWLDWRLAEPHIRSLLDAEDPLLCRTGIAAAAIHRNMPDGPLEKALRNQDDLVTPRALRAAGELGRQDLMAACQAHVSDDAGEIRFWAAWSAVVLGDREEAVSALAEIATEKASATAVRCMEPRHALSWQKDLAAQDGNRRLAIIAAGALGDPQLVPWLIEMMADDDHARVAGEAFSFITGLDLAYLDLDRDQPEDFEAGPTEDPADEDVAMDPDEDLPWADPELIGAWWKENGRRFQPGERYLVGLPVSRQSLQEVIVSGYQRQRSAAALELALLRPGRPLFEVRARGDRQLKELEG